MDCHILRLNVEDLSRSARVTIRISVKVVFSKLYPSDRSPGRLTMSGGQDVSPIDQGSSTCVSDSTCSHQFNNRGRVSKSWIVLSSFLTTIQFLICLLKKSGEIFSQWILMKRLYKKAEHFYNGLAFRYLCMKISVKNQYQRSPDIQVPLRKDNFLAEHQLHQ